MIKPEHYFICGIGGSGMLPLAILLKGMGHKVSGSDRSYDQGRNPEKFDWIKSQGMMLHPQDGSGVKGTINAVVISKAVEDTVPDIIAAKQMGVPIKLRVDMLIEMFNAAKTRIAVSGTSGKTTTTGMVGYILKTAGLDPTIMNGGIFKNYMKDNPYSTAFVGGDIFVTEIDESDGVENVIKFTPDISIIHNITLDHQPMEELRTMFEGFLSKTKTAILNADDENVLIVAQNFEGQKITYSINGHSADITAKNITPRVDGIDCLVEGFGQSVSMSLKITGRHNISNALAAIGAAHAAGLSIKDSCAALSGFTGIKRRMDVLGFTKNGVMVMDDFAHNPDKIAATLSTLKEFDGRLHLFFQPHGYGFLKIVGAELGAAFAEHMGNNDILYMVDPLYLGGTVDKSVGAQSVVDDVVRLGKNAKLMNGRDDVYTAIMKDMKQGDRIIIMGARDDTLTDFAKRFLY